MPCSSTRSSPRAREPRPPLNRRLVYRPARRFRSRLFDAGTAAEHRTRHAMKKRPSTRRSGRHPSLPHRWRPPPAMGIKVGAADRATRGKRRDPLAAPWAIAGMHLLDAPRKRCAGRKGRLSVSQEPLSKSARHCLVGAVGITTTCPPWQARETSFVRRVHFPQRWHRHAALAH
jgi:hypothetical protein